MGRVIGQTGKIEIRTGLGEDLGVTSSDHASSLSLKRPSHDGSATALRAACNDFVDELDKVIGKPHCDLLAHTTMVPKWDHPQRDTRRICGPLRRSGRARSRSPRHTRHKARSARSPVRARGTVSAREPRNWPADCS